MAGPRGSKCLAGIHRETLDIDAASLLAQRHIDATALPFVLQLGYEQLDVLHVVRDFEAAAGATSDLGYEAREIKLLEAHVGAKSGSPRDRAGQAATQGLRDQAFDAAPVAQRSAGLLQQLHVVGLVAPFERPQYGRGAGRVPSPCRIDVAPGPASREGRDVEHVAAALELQCERIDRYPIHDEIASVQRHLSHDRLEVALQAQLAAERAGHVGQPQIGEERTEALEIGNRQVESRALDVEGIEASACGAIQRGRVALQHDPLHVGQPVAVRALHLQQRHGAPIQTQSLATERSCDHGRGERAAYPRVQRQAPADVQVGKADVAQLTRQREVHLGDGPVGRIRWRHQTAVGPQRNALPRDGQPLHLHRAAVRT